MSDCKCLTSKYEFRVYKKHYKWWQKMLSNDYALDTRIVTVYGDTISELEEQRRSIENKLYDIWDKENYTVRVWVVR